MAINCLFLPWRIRKLLEYFGLFFIHSEIKFVFSFVSFPLEQFHFIAEQRSLKTFLIAHTNDFTYGFSRRDNYGLGDMYL